MHVSSRKRQQDNRKEDNRKEVKMSFVLDERAKVRKNQGDIDGRPEKVFKSSKKVCLEAGLWNLIAMCAKDDGITPSELINLSMKSVLTHRSAIFGGK